MAEIALCDRFEHGFGWIEASPMRRCAHALARGGQVWLVDPFEWDELDARVAELGEPAGVVQLLDRHGRDCAAIAARLGVPLFAPLEGRALPFELVRLLGWRLWREAALWWPETGVLVCADALGTVGYFRAGAEAVGVHPFLRPFPPRQLAGLPVRRLLVGHGEGLAGTEVAAQIDEALRTARRRLPAALRSMIRSR
jgi:hypothetical protein